MARKSLKPGGLKEKPLPTDLLGEDTVQEVARKKKIVE